MVVAGVNNALRDKFEGCLLGLALGDALGAPLEGRLLERLVWKFIGTTRQGDMRWTDDTQMSLDLAESLVANGAVNTDDLAGRFARSYRWSRGYGPGAAKLLKRIAKGADWRRANRSVFPDGSFGNGGAMRAAMVGLFHHARPNALKEAALESARVTHAHPLGMEGAVLVALATAGAVAGGSPLDVLRHAAAQSELEPFVWRLGVARAWLEGNESPSPEQVSGQLGNGIQAVESCVTAVYVGLCHLRGPFDEMKKFVAACGGDVDTIGAMAGAIWGASNGASRLPMHQLSKLEDRERLHAVAVALYERHR